MTWREWLTSMPEPSQCWQEGFLVGFISAGLVACFVAAWGAQRSRLDP